MLYRLTPPPSGVCVNVIGIVFCSQLFVIPDCKGIVKHKLTIVILVFSYHNEIKLLVDRFLK